MSDFYTLKGYKLKDHNQITEAMEDYLEMIFRLTQNKKEVTIKELSLRLNVKPSSVSKMIKRLKDLNLVAFEKYGKVSLLKEGMLLGDYYLYRHNVLKRFFKHINKEQYELKQVEMIEHFIDYNTIINMDLWVKKNN